MTINEAINRLENYPFDNEQDKEAAKEAIQALETIKTTALIINFNDEKNMGISVNPHIGNMMNEADTSNDVAGQRYYGIKALLYAAACLAADQVKDGKQIDTVMGWILESLSESLESLLDVQVEFGDAPQEMAKALDKPNKHALPS